MVFSVFLMFAVFRLLPPQGGESVAPYQAFGAHPLMQITETLHIMHCSKSLYTNITPFFSALQADPSDSANDTKTAPGFLSWKPGRFTCIICAFSSAHAITCGGS
jgi:ethanolamine transporter EutH